MLRILAIDFSAFFRRNWEASGGKELSEAYRRTLQTVAAIREGFDRVALLCDDGKSFRKNLLPTYKADREQPPAPYFEQRNRTVERLMKDGCCAFISPMVGNGSHGEALYVEADDLAWAVAEWCKSNGHTLTIYGGDKDLLQCVDDAACIDVIRPDHEGTWNIARVTEKFGVPPSLIADWLALGGDASDGFKMFPGWTDETGNHPGIGPKNAAALLQKFGSLYGVIDAIEATDEQGFPKMKDGAVKEALRRGKPTPMDAATLGLNLATLRCPPDLVDFSPLLAEPVFARLTEHNPPPRFDDTPHYEENGDRHASPPPPPPGRPTIADCPDARPTVPSEAAPQVRATTALARRAEANGIDVYALQPRSLDQMLETARLLYESRLYGQYPNAEAILAVALEANERGIPIGLALRNAYIVKGKPAWSAAFLAALVKRDPRCKVFRIVETTFERAVLEYQRSDEAEPSEFEFTIHEAERAGWLRSGDKGDSKWITNPRAMLRWAAMREAARAFFQDITAGMPEIDEEEAQ